MNEDIRWKQRYNNYLSALQTLTDAVALTQQRPLSQLEQQGLIQDGEAWMDMIKARNLTSHTYNTAIASGIAADILSRFYPAFASMAETFAALNSQTAPDA